MHTDLILARFAVPLAVAVVVALAFGFATRRPGAGRLAAVAVPAGLIAGYAVDPGWPWAPPTAATDQLAWLALGGALSGLALDLGVRGRVAATVAALFWPALGMAWLGGPALFDGEGTNLYRFGEVSVVLGLLLARLTQLSDQGLQGPVAAGVIAAGIAGLALVSGEPDLATIGFPLAAAWLGWLACNWPRQRLRLGSAGILGGSGVGLVLAGDAALLTPVNATLVLLVLSALVIQPAVPAIAARIPALSGPAVRPLVTAAVLAIPSALAVLIAWLAPGLIRSLY